MFPQQTVLYLIIHTLPLDFLSHHYAFTNLSFSRFPDSSIRIEKIIACSDHIFLHFTTQEKKSVSCAISSKLGSLFFSIDLHQFSLVRKVFFRQPSHSARVVENECRVCMSIEDPQKINVIKRIRIQEAITTYFLSCFKLHVHI